jgi:hypothetical protein
MARIAGKATKLSEKALKVYVSEERLRYLKRLYFIRKRELRIGDGFYSMSRFLGEIISLYIRDHWETLESFEKALMEMKKGNERVKEE